uniref:VWFA domain-containing protein n=1 Tax=Trichuris muris TaxID=70415 RepID=A0A5S6Q9P4_TRIMR
MIWCLFIIWIAKVGRCVPSTSELPLQALALSNDSQLLVVRHLPSSTDVGHPSRQAFYGTPVKMRQDLAALPIFMNADRVSKMLRNFANEEMATYFLQSKFDAMTYQVDNGGHSDEVGALADALASKIGSCVSAVGVIKKQILAVFQNSPYDMRTFNQYQECCTIDPHYLKHSPQHDALVNGSMSCDVVPKGVSAFSFYPGQNLTKAFLLNAQNQASILKQFFISTDGLRTEYPATRMDTRNYSNCELLSLKNRREVFASVAFDSAKQVVIVVQQGLGMSDKQLGVAKCVAKSLLNCLSEIDEVFVFAASDKLLMPANLYCANATTVASVEVKAKMEQFLDTLSTDSAFTNHTLALSTALEVIENGRSLDRAAKPIVLYISRGLQFQLAENNVQLNDVVTANERSANPAEIVNLVIWDCCQPPAVSRPMAASAAELGRFSYEQLLGLKSSAKKSSGSVFTANRIKVIVVNASDDECLSLKTLTQLFGTQQQRSSGKSPSSDVKIAAVDNPCTRRSPVLLASTLVHVGANVVGIVGVEVDFAELVAPIMYYSDGGVTSYAFLLDEDGNVIVHPHYVTLPSVRLLDVPVAAVEKRFPILEWKHSLKTQNSGQVLQLRAPGETNRTDADVLYYWKRVQSTPYVIVVASREKHSVERASRPEFSGVITRNLAYHRLDLLLSKDFNLCFHGKMLASSDRVGLYLAPRCFQNPVKRFTAAESKRTAQGFWAFVSDTTRLITNPGLKVNIRREIGALRKISTEWKRLATEGEFQSCVLRRYLATPSGVMLTFPAVLMHQQYDPVQREWFQRAVQHPSKVVITGPVIDPSGFGHVVSLSHTVYEGKAAAMHHVNDLVVAVLAIDVPVTFLYKMLYKHVTICREQDINCFLFDDRGYIVAYDNMQLQGDVIKRPEGLHITHKEPLIASEILQKSDFVRKVVCMRFSDRTVQRMYVFNTSYEDVIRNNDGCLRYQIAVVRQTNVFLAVVNRSCHRQSAFCPCSVTDRRCLNCFRSEPTECECPCECPLLSSYCPRVDTKTVSSKQLPICNAAAKEPLLAIPDVTFSEGGAQQVRQCSEVTCSNYKTQISCLGIVGCEWCHVDVDRVTPLQEAYCASVLVCFSGVLGLSPYGSIDQDILNGKFASSTPVGPVAGGIMGVFVLLVAGVYWYRQQVNRIMESRCYRANDSSATRLNNDLEEDFHFDDGSSNQPNINGSVQNNGLLLASFERQNLVAMPRPRSRWRPGSRAESSDPGYSTMTANCDDSEPTTNVDAVSSIISSGFKRSVSSRPIGGAYTGQINRMRTKVASAGGSIEQQLLSACNVDEEKGKFPMMDEKSSTSLKDKLPAVSNEFVITAQVHAAAS